MLTPPCLALPATVVSAERGAESTPVFGRAEAPASAAMGVHSGRRSGERLSSPKDAAVAASGSDGLGSACARHSSDCMSEMKRAMAEPGRLHDRTGNVNHGRWLGNLTRGAYVVSRTAWAARCPRARSAPRLGEASTLAAAEPARNVSAGIPKPLLWPLQLNHSAAVGDSPESTSPVASTSSMSDSRPTANASPLKMLAPCAANLLEGWPRVGAEHSSRPMNSHMSPCMFNH